jgi:hypothetical protein
MTTVKANRGACALAWASAFALACAGTLGACKSGDDDDDGTPGSGGAPAAGTGGVVAAGSGGMVAAAGSGGMTTAGSGGIGTGGMGAGGTAAAGSGGMTGGSGGGGAVGTTEPKFSAIYTNILTKGAVGNCTFGGCHGAEASDMGNGSLHMVATDKMQAYNALVGPKSTSSMCKDMAYVVPGNPEASLLVHKLRATPPCGMRMPLVPLGRVLTDAEMTQITTWIMNGAMND